MVCKTIRRICKVDMAVDPSLERFCQCGINRLPLALPISTVVPGDGHLFSASQSRSFAVKTLVVADILSNMKAVLTIQVASSSWLSESSRHSPASTPRINRSKLPSRCTRPSIWAIHPVLQSRHTLSAFISKFLTFLVKLRGWSVIVYGGVPSSWVASHRGTTCSPVI